MIQHCTCVESSWVLLLCHPVKISKSSRGDRFSKSHKGAKISKSSRGDRFSKSPKGEKISKSSRGDRFSKSPKGAKISKSSRGDRLRRPSESTERTLKQKKQYRNTKIKWKIRMIQHCTCVESSWVLLLCHPVKISKSSRGDRFSKSPKGEKISKSSRGDRFSKSPKGEKISKSSRGDRFSKSPKGEKISKSSRGDRLQRPSESTERTLKQKKQYRNTKM
ncbi:FMRFamide-related neuropeptides-like [Vespula maculifrons]|uniref:FMRFamide-related neuropeptides-like n=1 Tax=Vespula maculifrons TaxID=7453 RepID=A0ABD2BRL3_VESMC